MNTIQKLVVKVTCWAALAETDLITTCYHKNCKNQIFHKRYFLELFNALKVCLIDFSGTYQLTSVINELTDDG